MKLPSEWEPLGHTVGPFDELEFIESTKKDQAAQTWEVRSAARPDVVSKAIPRNPFYRPELSDLEQIKQAIAHSLRARVGKKEAKLPPSFNF